MSHPPARLGVITSGSLVEGLTARLDAGESVEDMRVGKFVVIRGEKQEFFSMVTDVALEATNQKVLIDPPGSDSFFHEVLAGTATYGALTLMPRLMLPNDHSDDLLPVKTIPRHFSPVFEACEEDFTRVFGSEGDGAFEIGQPLDMAVPVCLRLTRLVERSNGIFGKSGTGKSFLTRLLLCGTIQSNLASNLIFDMHSEYGWDSRSEGGTFVKGLRQIFGSDVLVYTLDRGSSQHSYDGEIVIGLDQIEINDVVSLDEALNLGSTASETAALLHDRFKERWLRELLDMDNEATAEFAESSGAHAGAISALRRKLISVRRLPFVRDRADFSAVDRMISALAAGRHVVLEFGGPQDRELAYMLVANIVTRRIHKYWTEQTEQFLRTKNERDRPRPLMITLEEAHKFLNPRTARQTIFGTIARELRKYSVTLLVVDQRPSSIDPEVMSQLGTRITALLNDDRDIDAVFTGVSGGNSLRAVLASLDSKQQALVLGHAVPMPVVIRTRPYDDLFYAAMQRRPTRANSRDLPAAGDIDDLFND